MHVVRFLKTDTILPIRPSKEKTVMYEVSEVVRMKNEENVVLMFI